MIEFINPTKFSIITNLDQVTCAGIYYINPYFSDLEIEKISPWIKNILAHGLPYAGMRLVYKYPITHYLTHYELDQFCEAKVNPIRYIQGQGVYALWGQNIAKWHINMNIPETVVYLTIFQAFLSGEDDWMMKAIALLETHAFTVGPIRETNGRIYWKMPLSPKIFTLDISKPCTELRNYYEEILTIIR